MHYRETLNVAFPSIGLKFFRFTGRLSKGLVCPLLLLALGGCDSQQSPPPAQPAANAPAPAQPAQVAPGQPAQAGTQTQTPEQLLEQRVAERWDALVARNFELAYTFETPSYRKVYDFAHYKGKFGSRIDWLGARVNKVKDVGNGVAEVMVKLRYRAAVPIPGLEIQQNETNLKEKWVQEEGTWFHVTE